MWKGRNKSTTPEMEDEIRKMWADDKPKCEIMRRFGLGRSVVDRVLTAHLPSRNSSQSHRRGRRVQKGKR